MWAKAANQSTESLLAGGLAFTFHHKLVLLRVKITNENVSNVTSMNGRGDEYHSYFQPDRREID